MEQGQPPASSPSPNAFSCVAQRRHLFPEVLGGENTNRGRKNLWGKYPHGVSTQGTPEPAMPRTPGLDKDPLSGHLSPSLLGGPPRRSRGKKGHSRASLCSGARAVLPEDPRRQDKRVCSAENSPSVSSHWRAPGASGAAARPPARGISDRLNPFGAGARSHDGQSGTVGKLASTGAGEDATALLLLMALAVPGLVYCTCF